jgi:hypothetical protein
MRPRESGTQEARLQLKLTILTQSPPKTQKAAEARATTVTPQKASRISLGMLPLSLLFAAFA